MCMYDNEELYPWTNACPSYNSRVNSMNLPFCSRGRCAAIPFLDNAMFTRSILGKQLMKNWVQEPNRRMCTEYFYVYTYPAYFLKFL